MHTHLDIDRTFCGYKWCNIFVAKIYHCLDIILKFSLISSNIDECQSLWYPPTHAILSPTYQFDIKDYPSWTKDYMSFLRFVQISAAFNPKSGVNKERDKCHQLQREM